jgi:N-acetyl sugar amidotransferase
MLKKHNVVKKYGLPLEVKFCKRCVMSNQRPRITFDDRGICSACNFSDFKKTLDWNEREKELIDLCNKYRKENGDYDVIVPCSGGKDGSFVAHQLKHVYGMNPLTVTWAPLLPTDIGRKNLDSFIKSGFINILGTPDGQVTRKLVKLSCQHVGDPFQPFIYGQTNFPLQIAVNYDIPLIMYGENGEVEYGGDMKNALKPNREIEDHDEHYFSGLPPEFWHKHGMTKKDLKPFSSPPYEQIIKNKTEIHFFGYYKFWDPQENYYYATEHTGFEPNPERNEGTYSKYASLDDQLDGFHFYLSYIKFGIGRATSDAAHEVRDKKIDREEAKALVDKYDGDLPDKYLEVFLDYCDMKEEEFIEMIDAWRSDHLWSETSNGWALKHAVWLEK